MFNYNWNIHIFLFKFENFLAKIGEGEFFLEEGA